MSSSKVSKRQPADLRNRAELQDIRTSGFDCALFDVDGVLVDIRRSYNTAIKRSAEFLLAEITGKSYRNLVTDEIILKFRQTGGFNNDTDTTYAIVLSTLAQSGRSDKVGTKQLGPLRQFLISVAENADARGYITVEKFLLSRDYDFEKFKDVLLYPAAVRESFVGRVFDELFYGPDLFKKQNNLEPKYFKSKNSPPLIRNDKLVVDSVTMRRLARMFNGNLAIVSGRSRLAAEYSLGRVFKYFNLDASVFLEDERREHAKPSPYAITKAMTAMKARNAVYAGDSVEDIMMARSAEREAGVRIAFVGIYGYSPQPSTTLQKFREQKVDATSRSVRAMPDIVLNNVSRKV